jgi:acetylornithine deacetylase/succinyl-diaminopimelate desuccinylase-like protein
MRAEGAEPAGDVLLALVADEEAGSRVGAGYLVDHHPELFDGVAYAVGEDGGASVVLGGEVRFHPIVVAEKRACWVKVTLHGPGGHASRVAPPASPVRQLHRLLTAIEGGGLGVIPTPAARRMLGELAAAPTPYATPLARLYRDPADLAPLADLPERDALYLRSVLQHSVNATVINAGMKTNVLPSTAVIELDGRLLPGLMDTAGFIAEVRSLIDPEADIELLVEGEPLPEPDFGGFYDLLTDILRQADPDGFPVPMMTTASTDARLFPKLGITCYGWLPMKFPAGINYRDLLHSADERIPVEALEFGTHCFRVLLRRYE